jgi:hypothetical protein
MELSSHRLRSEEKKLFRKLIFTLLIFFITILLLLYVGLPIFARIIVAISSLKREKPASTTIEEMIIFPPVLDPTFEATNTAKITVSGYSEKDAKVKILLNSKEKARINTDNEGKFKTNITLKEGTNIITAVLIKDKKESSPSAPLSIIFKEEEPTLEITSPSENQKFSGETKEISIIGKTDPLNKVTINDRMVIVDQDGKFNYSVKLSEGENTFKIVATDIAGNQQILERKVKYIP